MKKGLVKEDRSVVIPGDTLAIGLEFLPGQGTHRIGEEIRSSIIGLMSVKGSVVKVIPLSGTYIPRRGDRIIGQVIDISRSTWEVDIGAPATAFLGIGDATRTYIELGEDLSRYYDIGDYIYAEVIEVSKNMYIRLRMKERMFKKLDNGMILKISPVKVPRVIGKKGSMVNILKEETNCSFIVGQNGLVWIKGDDSKNELLAARAVKYIENNAHINGLTDAMKKKIGEWKNE